MAATDGVGYDRLLRLYQDAVPIDSELDAASLTIELGELAWAPDGLKINYDSGIT